MIRDMRLLAEFADYMSRTSEYDVRQDSARVLAVSDRDGTVIVLASHEHGYTATFALKSDHQATGPDRYRLISAAQQRFKLAMYEVMARRIHLKEMILADDNLPGL